MNNSKKGITLVELVISCTIMVLLAGACTAVLVSAQRLFISGSKSANNQLEANLLQTHVISHLPQMQIIEWKKVSDVESAEPALDGVSFYFNDSGVFTVCKGGSVTTINKVKQFEYAFKRVGLVGTEEIEETAKAQFVYTATLEDGTRITGGMVLTNIKYLDIPEAIRNGTTDFKNAPDEQAVLYFSVPPVVEDLEGAI